MTDIKKLKEVSSNFRVLYVEDDKAIAKTIINYLSKFFKEVIYASNGEEGLILYKQDLFHIVITDINMPKINGLDMIEKIKEINNEQNVIIISAYSDPDHFLSSIKLGVDGYIIKPVKYNDRNLLLYKLCHKIKNFNDNIINIEQQTSMMEHLAKKNLLLKQYTDVIDKVAIVSKTDLSGIITYSNDFFSETSGYSKEEIIGKSHNVVRHEDMAKSVYAEMWQTIQNGQVWEGTIKNKTKDGSPYFVHANVFPMLDDKNNITEYMGIRFLTTKEEMEKREFRKKVRSSYQEYKKTTLEASKKIEALNEQLSSTIKIDTVHQAIINDLQNRLEKSHVQINFYENKIKEEEILNQTKMDVYASNIHTLRENFNHTKKQIDIQVKELEKVKEDNKNKKEEVINLNSEVIHQRKIIVDLRDTIKNIAKEDKETEEEKSQNLFSKFIK